MDYYCDLRMLPDPEFSTSVLLNALYGKFHRALIDTGVGSIGVSFPEYIGESYISEDSGKKIPPNLGSVLRLHGKKSDLEAFMQSNWIGKILGYMLVGDVSMVPNRVSYVTFSRKQFKSNVDRLRQRCMKRHHISYEESCSRIPDKVEQKTQLPYLRIKSRSTNQEFRLFIEMKQEEVRKDGAFNSYGLSNLATVPLF